LPSIIITRILAQATQEKWKNLESPYGSLVTAFMKAKTNPVVPTSSFARTNRPRPVKPVAVVVPVPPRVKLVTSFHAVSTNVGSEVVLMYPVIVCAVGFDAYIRNSTSI
jgi:hypothetical protein